MLSLISFTLVSDYRDDRDFKNEPVEWRELKEFVVEQLKRAGQRIDAEYLKGLIRDRGGNVDKVLDKLARKGYLASEGARPPHPPMRKGRRHQWTVLRDDFENYETRRPARQESRFASFQRYRNKILKRVEKGFAGFRVHFTAFAAVNIFLFTVWLIAGGGHPWFLYAFGAWGIGLLNHLNPVLQKYRQRREVEALPDLTEKETRYLKRMHAARTGFAGHTISAASFSAYLIMINAITGGGFPWALIPAAAMGVALLLHWSAYGPKSRKMKREVRGWIAGNEGRRIDSADLDAENREPAVVQEASALRRKILRQIEEMEKDHPTIGGDMRPLLDTYFQQVRQLAGKFQEIDTILAQVPRIGLQQDRVRLKNRMEQVESDRLKEEYEKSILEIDRQLASLKQLAHNSEIIELRLSSAVNLMKQLQLDLARVKGATLQNTASFGLLKEKSDELSRYIEDLESGYNELETEL